MEYAMEIKTRKVFRVTKKTDRVITLVSASGEQQEVYADRFGFLFGIITDQPRLYQLGRTGSKSHYGSGMCGGTRINQAQYTRYEYGVPTCKKCLEHRERAEKRAKRDYDELVNAFLEEEQQCANFTE